MSRTESRWRLIGWPAAACLAVMSAAGLVLELGASMLALIVLLGLTSPWASTSPGAISRGPSIHTSGKARRISRRGSR